MRVEAENPNVAGHLQRIAATLRGNGGYVARDFIVREHSGEFSCAIGERFGEPDRIVVDYPQDLTVPMYLLEWDDNEDLIRPVAGLHLLSDAHRALLDDWLALVNETGKVHQVRRVLPRIAVANWPLRHHLADGGWTDMRESPAAGAARNVLLAWHSSGGRRAPSADTHDPPAGPTGSRDRGGVGSTAEPRLPAWRLIPLKHLVNHDPSGASQTPVPGRTAVATSATSNDIETFENYGDLDAMQLLMSFGYVDATATMVHSVPVEVASSLVGRVLVRWRAPRVPGWKAGPGLDGLARDIPEVLGRADGIDLRRLTFRPGNRPALAAFLAMAIQSRAGATTAAAHRESEAILDLIVDANLAYYRRLDELVVAAAPEQPIGGMLAAVSLLQQQRLTTMWG